MALSVIAHDEECVPPINFVSLAYNSLSPNTINSSTVFNTYATNGLAINESPLTIPTQCASGMDIVFLVDYTGSMGGAINGVKAGITNILNTINNESLGNYRVGLCIFDEYFGNITTPNNYGSTSTYNGLPTSQKARINTFNNRTQFITCMQPLGNIGSVTAFQTKLNLLATPSFPLGNGQGTPEPGELGVNEILSNNIAGSFRSDAIKLIILITDAVPGGNDDVNNSIDQAYINGTLIGLCNSYDVQVMTQSSLSANALGNYYYNLSTGTTIPGRYDQVTFDGAGNWINTGLVSGIQNLCDNSFIATCETAPTGWYYEMGAAYAVFYNSQLRYVTQLYYFPTATPVPDPTSTPIQPTPTAYSSGSGGGAGLPTATPTAIPPTSIPLFQYFVNYYQDGGATNSSTSCNNSVVAGSIWSTKSSLDAISIGDTLYSSANTSAIWNGNLKWYGLATSYGVAPTRTFQLTTSGVVATTSVCTIPPTATPVPPTATPVPPTATPIPPSGTCYHVFVSDNIDINRYGLSYWFGNHTQKTFNQILSSPYYYSGQYGAVYSVCSNTPPNVWDSQTYNLVILDGVTIIDQTGECTSEFGCSYNEFIPAPTPTPTPRPTTTISEEFTSYIAERNDGMAYAYIGPYSTSAMYTENSSVYVNDGSGICWTLGAPGYANYQYDILNLCGDPSPPPTPSGTRDTSGGPGGPLDPEQFQ